MPPTRYLSHPAAFRLLAVAVLAVPVDSAPAAGQAAPRSPAGGWEALAPGGVSVEGMPGFRAPAGTWRAAGGAWVDGRRAERLRTDPGLGLAASEGGGDGATLVSEWEHGDLEVELELLTARGGGMTLLLQGRYGLRLADSWAVRHPAWTAAGGIEAPREDGAGRGAGDAPPADRSGHGLAGVAPRINAAGAPGLWQRVRVVFRAPRTDADGRTLEPARFVRVEHNGVVIHRNVEVAGPTESAVFGDTRATGPLVVRAEPGAVAIRRLRHERFSGESIGLSGLSYRAAEGQFTSLTDAEAALPAAAADAASITTRVAGALDRFAVAYEGTMSLPASGEYRFSIGLDWITPDPHFAGRSVGGARLVVGGREVVVHDGLRPDTTGTVRLDAGPQPFTLLVYKDRPWTTRLGIELWAQGPAVQRHALHDVGDMAVPPPEAILVAPAGEPAVLRSFVAHEGGVRTHAVSVGDPEGVHYAYDLGSAALLHVWRGPFVETTDMWHSRGERQLALPLGAVLPLPAAPPLAGLTDRAAPWPDSANTTYRLDGYALDEAGRPTFLYRLGGLRVEDRLRPADSGAALRRELTVRAEGDPGGELFLRVAAGRDLRRLPDGRYALDDQTYYVALDRGARPVVRDVGGGQELLVPVRLRDGAAVLAYTLIW